MPTCSKVIGRKFANALSTDVNSRCRVNLTCDTVLTKIPNFVNPGISSVHASDELGSVFIPTTRIRRPTYGSNWILTGHSIGEVIADRVNRTGSDQNYNAKTDFETRRKNQNFGRQNNSMNWPHLDSTPLDTNTANRTISTIDSIPVRTKTPEPMSLTQPMEFSEQNIKAHVPGDPDPDPSSLDSSSNKSKISNDSNSSKLVKKKSDKKKNSQKHKKHDTSDSLSSDSGSSNNSDYRCKRRKKKSHHKTDQIKLCARLTAKFLTPSYKSKIIRLKMDEYPLQRRIYLLTFVKSLEMIISQYKETC